MLNMLLPKYALKIEGNLKITRTPYYKVPVPVPDPLCMIGFFGPERNLSKNYSNPQNTRLLVKLEAHPKCFDSNPDLSFTSSFSF